MTGATIVPIGTTAIATTIAVIPMVVVASVAVVITIISTVAVASSRIIVAAVVPAIIASAVGSRRSGLSGCYKGSGRTKGPFQAKFQSEVCFSFVDYPNTVYVTPWESR